MSSELETSNLKAENGYRRQSKGRINEEQRFKKSVPERFYSFSVNSVRHDEQIHYGSNSN